MRKFYLSYKVEELRCSGGQGPFPNFVILGLGKEAIHTGSVPSGIEGTSGNSASQLDHTPLEAGRRRKTRPERSMQDRLSH